MFHHPSKLILMRHGESVWNKLNLFTGWVDVPLSEKGIHQAIEGGKKIRNVPIDVIFVSSLIRSHITAFLAMLYHSSGKVPVLRHKELGEFKDWGKIHSFESEKSTIPVIHDWHLNERMYGELQGLNKAETAEKFGADQVKLWRRSFDVAPPKGESLKMTAERTVPYFKEEIIPYLNVGKNVFVSAHGNSLRSIVMHLDNLSPEEVVNLEIPLGEPVVYEYWDGRWEKEV